jgi:hypothetical protein
MSGEDKLALRGELLPQTPEEWLTEQFYAWERRGRGWQVWDYAVALEPPFVPFIGHYAAPAPVFDDARKPTFLGTLAEKIRARFVEPRNPSDSQSFPPGLTSQWSAPAESGIPRGLLEWQISLQPEAKVGKDASEQFLLSLAQCAYPASFELIGLAESISLQVVCAEEDRHVRQQIAAFFAGARVSEQHGFLGSSWDESSRKESVVVEFGLSHEFMRPLKQYERFDTDPLFGVAGALADLQQGELGVLQLLFHRARYPWAESALRAVSDWDGKSFFADAQEMVSLAREKVSRPLFAAVIRVAAQSPTYGRAWEIARQLGGALAQFADPLSNELIPLVNDNYPDDVHAADLVLRQSHRSGMLLSSAELVSFVHASTAPLRIPKTRREEKRTKRAPVITKNREFIIGENVHGGERVPVGLSAEHRVRHTYVIGASGTGKSSLLLNMIVQDVRNGEGLGVLDPHGDLVDQILGHIPEERFADVVLFDPSDEAYPIGFNILSAHSELEKNLLGSDLVSVFRRLSTTWGDQMGSVLANAILAFLESERGGTLADLRRFLVEPEFRDDFLSTVRDSEVVYYWEKEFSLLKGKPQAPILTRLDAFLRPKLIRHMVSQKENKLDFREIMDERKIFLAKLSQGAIGEVNAYLLGALLVSKFHQVAMSRQEVAVSERPPFYLYIDEFQNFVTPSMASVLSGARKYGLGLVLAHQELRQLASKDSEVASSVLSNPATRICFRLGDADAKKLAAGFSFFEAEDLQNLGVGEAICRVERAEYDFNLKTLPLPKTELAAARAHCERIIALSRERYGRRREEVEIEMPRVGTEVPPESKKEVRVVRDIPSHVVMPTVGPSRTAPSERVPALSPEPLLGRGGQQHKYLQQLVKRWAESRGFRATIEKKILDGLGSVDVALERNSLTVACEISVNSTPEQEIGNIRKCIAAGFMHIVVVSSEKKTLGRARESITPELNESELKQVQFLTPDELFTFVDALEAGAQGKEETVHGYKVKVQYQPMKEQEKSSRRQAISEVVLKAMKRLRGS